MIANKNHNNIMKRFHDTVQDGDYPTVQEYLKDGYDPNKRYQNKTSLMRATDAKKNREKIITLLLNHNADPKLVHQGKNSLEMYLYNPDRKVYPETLRRLFEAMFDVCSNYSELDPIGLADDSFDKLSGDHFFVLYNPMNHLALCLHRDWLTNAQIQVKKNWIVHPGQTMDSQGFPGFPGRKNYYPITFGNFTIYLDQKLYDAIQRGFQKDSVGIYFMSYRNPVRLGNPQGRYAESTLHGQLPPEDTYTLEKSIKIPIQNYDPFIEDYQKPVLRQEKDSELEQETELEQEPEWYSAIVPDVPWTPQELPVQTGGLFDCARIRSKGECGYCKTRYRKRRCRDLSRSQCKRCLATIRAVDED